MVSVNILFISFFAQNVAKLDKAQLGTDGMFLCTFMSKSSFSRNLTTDGSIRHASLAELFKIKLK